METNEMVFVFGSNLAGVHGAGAALHAKRKLGAIWGKGIGPMGQSYALPTKDKNIQTLDMETINTHVDNFLVYAHSHPEMQFQVTCIGCGLAGLEHKDIAPMFTQAPDNCHFDTLWKPWLGEGVSYWGTF